MKRVVVLGGGATGMTAAHALCDQGHEVTVLEREDRPGGLCGTLERRGFRFDLGGHRFLSRSSELAGLVRSLVGEDLLLRTRSSVVLNGGKRYRYPLELDDVLRQGGLRRGAAMLASYVSERLKPSQPEHSFEEWVTKRFGRVLYDSFFGPYTEKLWGIPPSQISADWAAQRISLLSLGDVGLRLLGLRRGGARTYARRYLYPRLGIGQIFERMAEETALRGGVLQLGARVVSLTQRRGKVVSVGWVDAQGQAHERGCDAVISTIPLPLVARMLAKQGLPRALEGAATRLRFRGIRLMNILLDQPQVSPHTWMYVSEPRYLAARIQEPRQRSPHMAPTGQTSLMLEIPCEVGGPVWSAPDAELYARCLEDLRHLGFPDIGTRTLDYFSSYVEEGYPVYHLDYQRDRQALLGFVGERDDLVSCGRQGAFRYIFMDTAMEMGLAAARRVAGGAAMTKISELDSERRLIEVQAITA